ncbi:uncharacterized protein [Amphiura filiformis]|uniref:uncharacterized protein isoform X2 n=1 Tax=Amphiura filiformis TaxID=82378 RepID=UPI003B20C54E
MSTMSHEKLTNDFSPVVTSQPESNPPAPGSTPINGVTVRPLQDTTADAEFAGKLVIEAFRAKMVYNVTEQKVPIVVKLASANNRGQDPAFYQRTLIAELEGVPVGFIQLKFHGDKTCNTIDEDDDYLRELGCWHAFRLWCFGCVTEAGTVEKGKCCVVCICVDDSARGRGIGKVLLDRAEYEARRHQCHTIFLDVLTTNRARNLYERQGYHVIGTTPICFYCCFGPPGSTMSHEKLTNDFSPVVTSQPESTPPAPGSTSINGVTVRPLQDTPTDAEFAGRLLVQGFRGKVVYNVTEQKEPIVVKITSATFRGQKQNPAFYQRTLVAELEGVPVGLIQLKFHGDKILNTAEHVMDLGCWHAFRLFCLACVTDTNVGKGKCLVDCICVDDSARGRGVGKLLMERAEYEARQRQCHTIYLGVLTNNRAKSLYERQGYHVTGTSSICLYCCIGPPGRFYWMEKPLSTCTSIP